jgi:cytochrome c
MWQRRAPSLVLLAALVVGCGEDGRPANSSGAGGASSSGGVPTFTPTGGAPNTGGTGAQQSGGAVSATGGVSGSGSTTPNVLVFSRTVGYRHASIEAGTRALQALAEERGFSLTATEDAAVFSADGLTDYDVVLFLNTTGDVLDEAQQLVLEEFVRSGHGFVGVHSACDTEYDWPWYGGLVGAYFRDHPPVQSATVVVEDPSHPATAKLPAEWSHTDEWYAFRENPRDKVHVLLRVDEATYTHDVGSMGTDHPIAWYHEYDGGRAIYTGLGHTAENYQEPELLEHLAGAIRWAAGG